MTTVTPLRCKPSVAGAMLGLDPIYVRRLVTEGVFTGIYPSGRGPGKRLWLIPGEVEAYAKGGVKAVKAWRKANRIPEPKVVK